MQGIPAHQAQQIKVAVGDARSNREDCIDQAVDVDALQILANQYQTGLVAQVVSKQRQPVINLSSAFSL
jgi:hypothetical protein